MTRWFLRGAALVVVLAGAFALFSNVTLAEPPIRSARISKESGREFRNDAPQRQSSSPGYTLLYSFSSDPRDNTYVASFTPDVDAIYAWVTVVEENGADTKQFTIDTQFVAPDGTPVDSEWYEKDTGTVTTYPSDADSFGDQNVARRFINVAGTPNANLTGQWTVNFRVGSKVIASGNFTLGDATDIGQSENAGNAEEALVDAGYEVIEFTEAEGKNGNLFAFVIMLPASQDLYSSETTQQIVDGLAALRQSFPDSGTLYVFLRYTERYEIAYYADALDVQDYLDDPNHDFEKFASKIRIDVYDNEAGGYLGNSSKDFINKNFGAGKYQNPPSPPLSKTSGKIGSVRVTVSPSELPADGTSKAIVTVEVFDKKNQPVPDAEVQFDISGSGNGSVRPRVTSTDENGEAVSVFTVGKTDGSVTITATSGGVTGSGVVTVGTGSSDQPADNVIALLQGQGQNATKVGYLDNAKTTVAVVIEIENFTNVNQLSNPILLGLTALRINYAEATTYVVMVPYQSNVLMFPATKTEYDTMYKNVTTATTQDAKSAAYVDFLTIVFGKSVYVDRNGKPISNFKDFYNKNFTGG